MGQEGDKRFLTREVTLCDNDPVITDAAVDPVTLNTPAVFF